jgi:hypothetical protein
LTGLLAFAKNYIFGVPILFSRVAFLSKIEMFVAEFANALGVVSKLKRKGETGNEKDSGVECRLINCFGVW